MKRLLSLIMMALLFANCSGPVKYELVIQNVELFDGHQDIGTVNVAINKDTIAAITPNKLAGDSIIDATGKYMIPGLVNAHVHASTLEHLKQGYRFGILTLLNMHTGEEERETAWKKISRDSLGYATLYGSGHAATVPQGHPTQFSPGMETINDSLSIKEWVDHRIANGVDYIKLIHVNRGWMDSQAPPSLSYEQIEELINYAHEQAYKVLIHATTLEEMVKIAKYKPDGFVHMLDYKEDYPVPDHYYQELRKSGAFIVTTGGIALKPMEGLPPFVVEWVTNNVLDAQQRAEIIQKYHQNDILLVAGTDAQEGQMDFGEDYFLELQLYQMAGMSNLEILKSATGNAADAFDLPIGKLEVGGKATFVILENNPLQDLTYLKKIEQVWKNGISLPN